MQQGVQAANNLAQILAQATVNSSSLQVGLSSTFFGTGTVTTINTSVGLTGGPITTTGTLAVSLVPLSNSLGADVTLNTSSYLDGPSVAQGSSGEWLAIGQVTVLDTAGGSQAAAKLWDGTTVIDSAIVTTPAANFFSVIPLSGVITSPSSNIKISCIGGTTTIKMKFNGSGNSKDSTITVVRIG